MLEGIFNKISVSLLTSAEVPLVSMEGVRTTCRCLDLLADELNNYGTRDRFVLCTRGELLKYRVPNLIDAYQQHGICMHGDTPDTAECCRILEELRSWVSAVR